MSELDESFQIQIEALTRQAVLEKLRYTPRGVRITYHHGMLACDREKEPVLHATAKVYQEMAELGAVILTQRRALDGKADYIAIRTRGARL